MNELQLWMDKKDCLLIFIWQKKEYSSRAGDPLFSPPRAKAKGKYYFISDMDYHYCFRGGKAKEPKKGKKGKVCTAYIDPV